ncbi:hypothetical protein FIBSPDRAFT_870435 [Athelia psychrophila]|uniref:Uncharacterized protein n=1 Tax=Athelia psychrophila TaxID=1759441 RepID=A0A166B445_9AGAM|nr:hypothetical protein FIBSPDRAFT_870435 [Fibularhizoctonia sp. CBS 109695]
MSGKELRTGEVARSVSGIRYVALVQRRLGHELRDEGALKREDGAHKARAGLGNISDSSVGAEKDRRRRSVEDDQCRALLTRPPFSIGWTTSPRQYQHASSPVQRHSSQVAFILSQAASRALPR